MACLNWELLPSAILLILMGAVWGITTILWGLSNLAYKGTGWGMLIRFCTDKSREKLFEEGGRYLEDRRRKGK
jgi:hypothetical protein